MNLISVPSSSRWVAKLWRSACSVTPFLIPAASAASWNRRLRWRGVIGLSPRRARSSGLMEQAVELAGRHRLAAPEAGKQPTFFQGRSRIVPRRARLPPLPQQSERLGRQHDIAVLAALGLLDANDLLRAVDMLDLEPDHLAGAQPAAIAETEQCASLEAAGDGQQAPRLVLAHHQRDLLRLADVIDLGGKIQSPQRHAEQEPQPGHDAVAIADAHV